MPLKIRSILVCEDNPRVITALKGIFKESEISVTWTSRTEQALSWMNSDGDFNLLITNIGLKGTSGVDLIRKVRSNSKLPCVMVSAYLEGSKLSHLDPIECIKSPIIPGRLKEVAEDLTGRTFC